MGTSKAPDLINAQMKEILDRISEYADDGSTINESTKRYELLGNTIYVRVFSRFEKYIVRFCNLHAEFLQSLPNHLEIDKYLFNDELDALLFIAIGRAYRLFDSRVEGMLVVIGRYEVRPEPLV